MKLKNKLYNYQKDVLDIFDKEIEAGEKKIHIVSPPGSGKTIMGLEMISRINGTHLILVPNITLQYQWKEKIKQFFLEENENIDDIVSTTTDEIKKVNIITYQSLTSSNKDNDLILDKILHYWFEDYKAEFISYKDFLTYIENLKLQDIEEYKDKISKYKKILKTGKEDLVVKLLSKKVLDYFNRLKKSNIESIVVDEAHHLTSWWSKVVYFLWESIGKTDLDIFNPNHDFEDVSNSIISSLLKLKNKNKYSILANYPVIIGLTATPPYDDIDFFTLDDDYSKLLGEVDYYIPTPAVVKSSRLAPWSDLVYFVEPGDDLKQVLEKTDIFLEKFLIENKNAISEYIYSYIKGNYNVLLKKSYLRLINYLRFLRVYSDYDISDFFFDEKIGDELLLEDIAKTTGLYISSLEIGKYYVENKQLIEYTKKLFYDLGYIFRARNFYKFRTKIENMLVYSKSKINGVKAILDQEKINLKKDLKCAIITDYLNDRDGIISCKYILQNLTDYKDLNPVLVSGQGIWKLGENGKLQEIYSDILGVTNWLEEGKINLIIGTRGILGEGWDAPKLNTLIDLTGIVAYMSVNQVRGRAIRLDRDNFKKVSNIYDIVTYYDGYTKDVDFYRLERKHEKFYGVDDSGLIIRGLDHIYPNISKHISDYKNINENMLKRSTLRDYYYKLWDIGGGYQNKEVFGLNLELNNLENFIPFVNFSLKDSLNFGKIIKNKDILKDKKSSLVYKSLMYKFLKDFIKNILKTMKKLGELPPDFKYTITSNNIGGFNITSNYKDEFIIKKFMIDISKVFSTPVNQKYILEYPFAYFDGNIIKFKMVNFALPDSISKNKKTRFIFIKELKNDFLISKSLINKYGITDKLFKGSILSGTFGGFSYLLLLFPNIGTLLAFIFILEVIFIGNVQLYTTKRNIINKYKDIFKKFKFGYKGYSFDFIYLQSKNIDRSKYIGKKPIIEAKIEKLWI